MFLRVIFLLTLVGAERFFEKFEDFRQRFNRKYESLEQLIERFEIFKDNLKFIEEHNSGFHNFTLSINQFADLTNEEFKSRNNGLLKVGGYGCQSFVETSSKLPESVDWRKKGAVTSVKDQGQCGSCWTFSATGAIEGSWAISKNELLDLSEQELVDCAQGIKYGSHGCNGGQMDGAFKFVIENGQCSDSEYPYESGVTKEDGNCESCKAVVSISSCYDVESNNQQLLKDAVYQQPVSIAIEADTRYFQSYSSGILDSAQCGTKLDHGVLIVGYGEENGMKYWLVKNSWGTSWGDDGYVKIERSDSTNDPGICGIAMQPSFPVV
jgi:KDEL-tailed cysteine endopeptidase